MFETLRDLANQIVDRRPDKKTVLAQDYPGLKDGLPMLTNIKIGKAKNYLEINLTTLGAQAVFDWITEITVSTDDDYRHFLLLKDGRIVEAYGKQVSDADLDSQKWLQAQLEQQATRLG